MLRCSAGRVIARIEGRAYVGGRTQEGMSHCVSSRQGAKGLPIWSLYGALAESRALHEYGEA